MNKRRFKARVTVSSKQIKHMIDQNMPTDVEPSTELSMYINHLSTQNNSHMLLCIKTKSVMESVLGRSIKVPLEKMHRVSMRGADISASVNLHRFMETLLKPGLPCKIDLTFYKDVLIVKAYDPRTMESWEKMVSYLVLGGSDSGRKL